MLSEFWGFLPYLFKGYGIFFKIIKGILDTGTPPLSPPSRASFVTFELVSFCIGEHEHPRSLTICCSLIQDGGGTKMNAKNKM